ncbi:NADP-dependent oxidoreductase [Isoptericola sp. b515]|uniref:NADP-dependent oxidoreductase n=1 Tax=Isoptericola sp. b515 TaxID=3064652 RepID=UPI002712A5E1|nr:NADP-dependent oxidoreductase [Isoptericola sp. b515]MDO8147589.1 NADP-dependent oxidoreductase [Isoptericola sp. b515]
MRAIVFTELGGPEVLHLADVPAPEPAAGQVRVRVEAAAVNGWDLKTRAARIPGVPLPEFPAVPGLEVVGVVDAVGDDVTGVRPGDRVVGFADTGGYAELALTSTFALVPDGLDPARAVTVPVSAETAHRVLRVLGVTDGETLLVHGASGSVGELAVQLARRRGATVIGTASPANQDRVAALGATPTTYGPGLVERVRDLAPSGVDAVLDTTGAGVLPDSITLRGGTERIVTIADPAASDLGITFSSGARRDPDELAEDVTSLARGELTTTLGEVLRLDDAARAHALVESGRGGGKVVLTP